MERHLKDLLFPFLVSGASINLVKKYDQVLGKLQGLKHKLAQENIDVDIDQMWSVRCSRGKLFFYVTPQCEGSALKNELLAIFAKRDGGLPYTHHYKWKKAPKLSAFSILSVVD